MTGKLLSQPHSQIIQSLSPVTSATAFPKIITDLTEVFQSTNQPELPSITYKRKQFDKDFCNNLSFIH